jgi:3-mercaptopyruvate sulfurtransferase SseA
MSPSRSTSGNYRHEVIIPVDLGCTPAAAEVHCNILVAHQGDRICSRKESQQLSTCQDHVVLCSSGGRSSHTTVVGIEAVAHNILDSTS